MRGRVVRLCQRIAGEMSFGALVSVLVAFGVVANAAHLGEVQQCSKLPDRLFWGGGAGNRFELLQVAMYCSCTC